MGNVVELRKKEIEEVAEQGQQTDLPKFIQYVEPGSLVEHEEAHRIPEMNPEEWLNFFESVRTRNQIIEPLSVTSDGRVYDGRHRLRAAKELGLRFVPVIFHSIDEEEVLQRMADAAILRRSLTKGQRAAVILEFKEMVDKLREQAIQNQEQAGEYGKLGGRGNKKGTLSPDLGGGFKAKGKVAKQLAEKAGIGRSTMEYLMAVQRDAPDLFELVKAGKMSINKAYTTKKEREEDEGESLKPTAKSNKKQIKETLKTVEELNLPADETKDTLDPVNLVRDQINRSIPQFARQYIYVYEVLPEVDKETLDGYTKQLQSVAEGSLLILRECL